MIDKKPIANFSKYHKPDDVGRIGRLYRGERKYLNGKKDHKGKGKTLRDHRGKPNRQVEEEI